MMAKTDYLYTQHTHSDVVTVVDIAADSKSMKIALPSDYHVKILYHSICRPVLAGRVSVINVQYE